MSQFLDILKVISENKLPKKRKEPVGTKEWLEMNDKSYVKKKGKWFTTDKAKMPKNEITDQKMIDKLEQHYLETYKST
jgi:hypothetical protein